MAQHGPQAQPQAVHHFARRDGLVTRADAGRRNRVQLFIRSAGGVAVGALAERMRTGIASITNGLPPWLPAIA